jgi:hypothetical protein
MYSNVLQIYVYTTICVLSEESKFWMYSGHTKGPGKCVGLYWSRTNYRQVPIIANLHVTRERTRIFGPLFADDNIYGDKADSKILHLYLG